MSPLSKETNEDIASEIRTKMETIIKYYRSVLVFFWDYSRDVHNRISKEKERIELVVSLYYIMWPKF